MGNTSKTAAEIGGPGGGLGRDCLLELVEGGFDDLAGPLGRDAVTSGHVLQLATLAGGADAELGVHKVAITPTISKSIAQGCQAVFAWGVRLHWHFPQGSGYAKNWLKTAILCCRKIEV